MTRLEDSADLYRVIQPIEDALGGTVDIRITLHFADDGNGGRGVDYEIEEVRDYVHASRTIASDCGVETFADALRAIAEALRPKGQ